MPNILFAAHPSRWTIYETPLRQAMAKAALDATLAQDIPADDVDYIIYAPNSPVQDFSVFGRLKAVLNLWAGVEAVVGNPTLTVPLVRMVDPGLTQGMVEWVVGQVLRHHLGTDQYIGATSWQPVVPPLAWDRKVAVLGLGKLGSACAAALAGLGFDVHGYSRRARDVPGVTCHHGDGMRAALDGAGVVVLLLPDTPETRDVMNAQSLGWLSPGAAVVNPGRGSLIDDAALLAALDSGQVGAATLDVFRCEPLPGDHPYWSHPRVTVTPHIASETRPESAARTLVASILDAEAGRDLRNTVDRAAGY